jgi:hypothetical protein
MEHFKSLELARKTAEECVNIEECEIKNHIQKSLKIFVSDMNIEDSEYRQEINTFLLHQSNMFMNYIMNRDDFLLDVDDVDKCIIGVGIIRQMFNDFTETGL